MSGTDFSAYSFVRVSVFYTLWTPLCLIMDATIPGHWWMYLLSLIVLLCSGIEKRIVDAAFRGKEM